VGRNESVSRTLGGGMNDLMDGMVDGVYKPASGRNWK
jgi:hypothetical protein